MALGCKSYRALDLPTKVVHVQHWPARFVSAMVDGMMYILMMAEFISTNMVIWRAALMLQLTLQ